MPDLGTTTIVCGWVFATLSILSVSRSIRDRFHRRAIGLDDWSLVFALVLAVALVAQTTWAILDEHQSEHISNTSRTQIELLGKVFNPDERSSLGPDVEPVAPLE